MSKDPVGACYILATADARVTPSARGSRLKEDKESLAKRQKGRDMKAFVAAALSAVIAVSMSPIPSPAQVHGATLLATARQDIGQIDCSKSHDLQAPRKNEEIEALLDCQDVQTARENQDVQAPRENLKMIT